MDPVEYEGPRNAFFYGDVIVSSEHAAAVRQVLRSAQVAFDDPKPSPDLGLELLRLQDDDVTAAGKMVHALERDAEADAEVAVLVREAAGRGAAGQSVSAAIDEHMASLPDAMDRFLWALRTHFAVHYAGWIPTMGKNRLVGHVAGGTQGHISHTGDSVPTVSDWRPAMRAAEPGRGARVGVLDTAVSPQAWLAGGWTGSAADVLDRQPPYPAVAGHGTFVTGLVLRTAPGCVVQVRSGLSDETGEADSWAVANKIVELGRSGLDVLNLSMVCYTEDNQPPLVLATAIDRLDPDIMVVAAAGNHGALDPEPTVGDRRKPAWPAALDDVIAVGAADSAGKLSKHTPKDVPWIDVVSNGVDVASTFLEGEVDVADTPGRSDVQRFRGYAEWTGSSFAAALVSGAIAARTKPGRRSARRAWHKLVEERERLWETHRVPREADPRFLPLLDDSDDPAGE